MAEQFNQDRFNEFVLDNGVIGFFEEPVTLKSGAQSYWYANWRTVTEDVFLTSELADFVLGFANNLGLRPDTFYGVPEGATKLALIAQDRWAKSLPDYGVGSHVLAMGRAQGKRHGIAKDRYFLGAPRGNVVVLEDVTTTGDSVTAEINKILDMKANEEILKIIKVIGLTDRMALGEDGRGIYRKLDSLDVDYTAMSNAEILLPLACKRLKPSDEIVESVEREFDRRLKLR